MQERPMLLLSTRRKLKPMYSYIYLLEINKPSIQQGKLRRVIFFYNSFDHFFPQGVKSQIKNAVAGTKHIAKVKANVFILEAFKLFRDSPRISYPILYEAKVP